jgi:hypothetical protein
MEGCISPFETCFLLEITIFLVVDMFPMEKYKPLYHWLVEIIISSSRHVSNGEIQTSVSLTGENTDVCISPLETCLQLEIITFTSQWYRCLYLSIGNISTTRNNYFHQSMIQRLKLLFLVVNMFPMEKYSPPYHWLAKVIISSGKHDFNGEIQTSVSLTGESNYF